MELFQFNTAVGAVFSSFWSFCVNLRFETQISQSSPVHFPNLKVLGSQRGEFKERALRMRDCFHAGLSLDMIKMCARVYMRKNMHFNTMTVNAIVKCSFYDSIYARRNVILIGFEADLCRTQSGEWNTCTQPQ